MPLLKDGKRIEDIWTSVADNDPLPKNDAIIVSLVRWQKDRDQLIARSGAVGVHLTSGQSPNLIAEDLDKLSLVELEFPAFTDGRGYSYARLLHRFGFKGEIRAVGDVLRDQYLNMKRCGIDTIRVRQGETEADWAKAVGMFSAPYQSAQDETPSILSLRERRRAAA